MLLLLFEMLAFGKGRVFCIISETGQAAVLGALEACYILHQENSWIPVSCVYLENICAPASECREFVTTITIYQGQMVDSSHQGLPRPVVFLNRLIWKTIFLTENEGYVPSWILGAFLDFGLRVRRWTDKSRWFLRVVEMFPRCYSIAAFRPVSTAIKIILLLFQGLFLKDLQQGHFLCQKIP